MSLEKPSPPCLPAEAAPTNLEDPAILLSSSWQENEADWEVDFLAAISGPDSGEDRGTSQSEDNSILPQEKITKILEFKVPVSNDTKPQGSIAVENIWDPNLDKTAAGSSLSPPKTPVPLYIVDITPDGSCVTAPPPPPAEESFILPQSPPEEVGDSFISPSLPPDQHFLISVPEGNSLPTAVCIPASSYMKTPPMSPETRFLENHSIMKWVIDDQDQGDIPGLSGLSAGISGASPSQITATVTSQSALDSKTECFAKNAKVLENCEVKPSQRKREPQPEISPGAISNIFGRMQTGSVSTSESESHVSDSTDLTDDEVSASKYRRMRDLNNEASRRCRDRRRMKQQKMATELDERRNKNLILKEKCDILELKTRKIKNYILKSFKNPQLEIALAHQRRIFGETPISSENIGIFSDPKDLPDVDCSWLF